MTDSPVFYATPSGEARRLEQSPRLASWNASTHPDQLALRGYLEHAHGLVAKQLKDIRGSVALRLDVGLPPDTDLLDGHDLDNYAFPLAVALEKATSKRITSVRCTKQHQSESWLTVAQAELIDSLSLTQSLTIQTTASATTKQYKEQINEHVRQLPMLQPGPVGVDIAFVVAPRRNWMNLWKPTIDSLDPLLGRSSAARDWNPLDGRIVDLGLHCHYDASLGNDVLISIGAANATAGGHEAARLVPVPAADAPEAELNDFALTFDAYAIHGSNRAVSGIARFVEGQWDTDRQLCEHVDCLRSALFFKQRQLHHTDGPQLTQIPLVAALLGQLRRIAPSGVPAIGDF